MYSDIVPLPLPVNCKFTTKENFTKNKTTNIIFSKHLFKPIFQMSIKSKKKFFKKFFNGHRSDSDVKITGAPVALDIVNVIIVQILDLSTALNQDRIERGLDCIRLLLGIRYLNTRDTVTELQVNAIIVLFLLFVNLFLLVLFLFGV